MLAEQLCRGRKRDHRAEQEEPLTPKGPRRLCRGSDSSHYAMAMADDSNDPFPAKAKSDTLPRPPPCRPDLRAGRPDYHDPGRHGCGGYRNCSGGKLVQLVAVARINKFSCPDVTTKRLFDDCCWLKMKTSASPAGSKRAIRPTTDRAPATGSSGQMDSTTRTTKC